MNYLKITIVFLFLCYSCGNSKEKSLEATKVSTDGGLLKIVISPPTTKLPYLKLSDIADDIQYIKLETKDDALLSYGRVYFSDKSNCLFVMKVRDLIYSFDISGKFIRKIGKMGQGPGEFLPHLMDVDFNNRILYIYTQWGTDMVVYDFEGEYLHNIKNDLVGFPAAMKLFNGKILFANEISKWTREENPGGYMELYSFDPDSNIIDFYLPNRHYYKEIDNTASFTVPGQEHLEVSGNVAYYKMQFSDTLYRVANDQIVPFLIFDMGRYKYDLENSQINNSNAKYGIELLAGKILMTDITATKNHLLFGFRYYHSPKEWTSFIGLYNMQTQKLIYYNNFILNNLTDGPNVLVASIASSPFMLEPERFKEPNEEVRKMFYSEKSNIELKFPERKDEFKELMDQSEFDDNPIVQIVTLKETF